MRCLIQNCIYSSIHLYQNKLLCREQVCGTSGWHSGTLVHQIHSPDNLLVIISESKAASSDCLISSISSMSKTLFLKSKTYLALQTKLRHSSYIPKNWKSFLYCTQNDIMKNCSHYINYKVLLDYIIPMKCPRTAFSIYKQNLSAEYVLMLKYCLKFYGTVKTYVDCQFNIIRLVNQP